MREQEECDRTEGAYGRIYASPDDAQRLLLSRLWLRTRTLFEEQYGDMETTYILMAVGLGRMNKAPVDISTISAITGVSRPTVRRKVLMLEEQGMVEVTRAGNRTLVCTSESGVRNSEPLMDRWARLVIQAARDLSAVREESKK